MRSDVEMLERGRGKERCGCRERWVQFELGKVERVISGRECAGFYVW